MVLLAAAAGGACLALIVRGYPGGQELHSAYRWITFDI